MTGAFGMVETHLRGKRILLVDDERELADMVATILHGAGFASVDIANSSAEALSSIAARSASGVSLNSSSTRVGSGMGTPPAICVSGL